MMAKPGPAIMDEPLVAQHSLGMQLLYETHHDFAESEQAAACPRMQPRKGQQLGGVPAVPRLTFTRAADCYDTTGDGGALLRGGAAPGAGVLQAVCAGHRMATGRHAAEFTLGTDIEPVQAPLHAVVGVARPEHQPGTLDFWGVGCSGHSFKRGIRAAWDGQQRFGPGDVVGLLLDCDAGTLTIKKNGTQLGVAVTGLSGELCWAASCFGTTPPSVCFAAADAALF